MFHSLSCCTLGFLNFENPMVLLVLAVFAVLVFGKRLPEVGRNLGRGVVEFKKGLAGIEDDSSQVKTTNATPPQVPAVEQAPRLLQPSGEADTIPAHSRGTTPHPGSPSPGNRVRGAVDGH